MGKCRGKTEKPSPEAKLEIFRAGCIEIFLYGNKNLGGVLGFFSEKT